MRVMEMYRTAQELVDRYLIAAVEPEDVKEDEAIDERFIMNLDEAADEFRMEYPSFSDREARKVLEEVLRRSIIWTR